MAIPRRTSISLHPAHRRRRQRLFVRLRTEAAAVRCDCEVILHRKPLESSVQSRRLRYSLVNMRFGCLAWPGRHCLRGMATFWIEVFGLNAYSCSPLGRFAVPSAAGLKWCLSASLRGPALKKGGKVRFKHCNQPGFYHCVHVCHP